MIKRYFFTGLAILLPVVVTILIVNFFINLLTKPFQNFVEDVFSYYGLFGKPFLLFSSKQIFHYTSKFLILVTIVIVTFIVGLLAQRAVARYFFKYGDYIIHNIPLVNKIYKATQEVVRTIFVDEGKAFSKVVLVPFPHEHSWCFGLVTKEQILSAKDIKQEELISVFVPATPNPSMGYIIMVKKSQAIYLDITVESALKTIISCGVIFEKKRSRKL